jgi:hypothetical protein
VIEPSDWRPPVRFTRSSTREEERAMDKNKKSAKKIDKMRDLDTRVSPVGGATKKK